jgi:hypothetical protein
MPMLPNLRELVVKDVTGRSPCIAHLFLGPRLESIRMAHLQQSESVLAFVHSINTHCLSLKRLDIDLLTVQYLFQVLPKLILGRVELESLRIPFLSSEILAHIATWPRLRHLEVDRIRTEDIGPISGSGLTRITDLELSSGSPDGALTFNQFISLCRPYQLRQLSLAIENDESASSSEWQHCFETLSRYCSSTLEVLHISQEEDGMIMIEHGALQPLLTFRNLRHLSMTRVLPDLDNHWLREMAQAWPHLQVLDVVEYRSQVLDIPISGITLEGILPVLEHCPDLMELALTINAPPHCIQFSERPWRSISNRNITTLNVGDSVIEDPVDVAHFLTYILPNLKNIISWGNPDLFDKAESKMVQIYRSRWEEVLSMMKDMKVQCLEERSAVREHENVGSDLHLRNCLSG